MTAILKYEYNGDSIEIENMETGMSLQTCNETLEDYQIWTQVVLNKQDVEELIEYLQKRLKEME